MEISRPQLAWYIIVIFFVRHSDPWMEVGATATPVVWLPRPPFFVCIFMGLDGPSTSKVAVIFAWVPFKVLLSQSIQYARSTTQMATTLDAESKMKGKSNKSTFWDRESRRRVGLSFNKTGLSIYSNIINAAPAVGVIFTPFSLDGLGLPVV
jgi:hypothetical protein